MVRSAISSGIVQYLIKPFSYEDLRDRLMHYQHMVRTMEAIVDKPDQADVDRVFGKTGLAKPLPKGLSIETLTLVPFDGRLVVAGMLSAAELAWLNAYHARVRETIGPELEPEDRAWLEHATQAI